MEYKIEEICNGLFSILDKERRLEDKDIVGVCGEVVKFELIPKRGYGYIDNIPGCTFLYLEKKLKDVSYKIKEARDGNEIISVEIIFPNKGFVVEVREHTLSGNVSDNLNKMRLYVKDHLVDLIEEFCEDLSLEHNLRRVRKKGIRLFD